MTDYDVIKLIVDNLSIEMRKTVGCSSVEVEVRILLSGNVISKDSIRINRWDLE